MLFWRIFFLTWVLGFSPVMGAAATEQPPLPVAEAFQLSAKVVDLKTIQLDWDIAPGYYLYQDRIQYQPQPPDAFFINDPILPPAIIKHDAYLGDYAVYENALRLTLPLTLSSAGAIHFTVQYQGCSQSGFCYPPVTKAFTLNTLLPGNSSQGSMVESTSQPKSSTPSAVPATSLNEQDGITQFFYTHNSSWIWLAFLGFGLLLAFTPCVLPMIPILSGIIIGQREPLTTGKAFRISLVYVLSMALTYAVAGVLAGLMGSTLQASLQNPWVIGSFSGVFVLLALSMFGFYELRLPQQLNEKLDGFSRRQRGGRYLSVFIMGCLATLIVSPCVTPALIGALAYISQSGDAWLGGSALFMLGIGMGLPLIALGTFGGRLLPKAGLWMNTIKAFFGVLMLGLALWLLTRIIPAGVGLFLWGAFALMVAVQIGAFDTAATAWSRFWKGLGLILGLYGALMIVGSFWGQTHPLNPLPSFSSPPAGSPLSLAAPEFSKISIKSLADLERILSTTEQPVIVDFYADWCISCQVIEHEIFANPTIQQQLKGIQVVQADVTANDAVDKALEAAFRVYAPPTLLFFNEQGQEQPELRLVGEFSTETFLQRVAALKATRKAG